jgi:putative NADH-flavin reductase
MKLTIFGSTGGTGQQIVAQALELGHDIKVFARSPEKLDKKDDKLQVIPGDVMDFDSVEPAIQGQDAVLCALGLSSIMDRTTLRANGTKNIVRAMEKTGVKRLICMSALGVGDSRNLLPFHYKYLIVPLMLRFVYADHEIQESHIKKSQLDWVIVRAGTLTDGKHTRSYLHGFAADNKTVTFKISRADVADFMLRQLSEKTYLHKAPCISY